MTAHHRLDDTAIPPSLLGFDPSASLVEQLHGLYADRELLESALGTSDPRILVQRVRSLEGQLQAVSGNLAALGRALGAADLNDFVLRTEATIQNLTEQLHDVYAEREQAPAMTDSLVAQLHDLYATRETEGASTASLVAQLEALYAEREAGNVAAPAFAAPVFVAPAPTAAQEATIANLVAQLEALYAERERDEARAATPDRVGGVTSARERAEVAGLQASVDSLTNQLASLYRDRELLEHAFGSASAEDIALRVLDREDSFVAQLEALYAEREAERAEHGGLSAQELVVEQRMTIGGLIAQLESLYAEREFAPSPSRDELLVAQASLVAQLEALYADRDGGGTPAPPLRTALDEIRARFVGR